MTSVIFQITMCFAVITILCDLINRQKKAGFVVSCAGIAIGLLIVTIGFSIGNIITIIL